MIRISIVCGLLLLAAGFFGIAFPQLFGSPPNPDNSGGVSIGSENALQDDTQSSASSNNAAVSKIDRIVVAGIVLPAAAGCFLLTISALGSWVTRTNSWFYVGMMTALPPMLMLLLSAERIADWFTVPWSVHWVPVLQLLIGSLVCAYAALQFIQHGLPGNAESESAESGSAESESSGKRTDFS